MRSFSYELPGSDARPLRGEVHLPDAPGPRPIVVLVHGFKGFRRWGFWPAMAERFTRDGLACVGFDLSHNGVGPGGLEFDEPELFERNTFARELFDLQQVLAAVRERRLPHADELLPDRLALLGHSRGGGLVVVTAADDPAIRAVVALAPIASNRRLAPDDVESGLARGFHPVVNTRTGQVLHLGRDALLEIQGRDDLADFTVHAARLAAPLLVVHGTADPAVSVDDGRRLAAAAPVGEFVGCKGADHVLGCRHPWAGSTPHFERFLDRASAFLREHV